MAATLLSECPEVEGNLEVLEGKVCFMLGSRMVSFREFLFFVYELGLFFQFFFSKEKIQGVEVEEVGSLVVRNSSNAPRST